MVTIVGVKRVNLFSPNIQMQILQIDFHTFLKELVERILINDQSIFPVVIIELILITISIGYVLLLLGEDWCWSLLGLKGLMGLCFQFTSWSQF